MLVTLSTVYMYLYVAGHRVVGRVSEGLGAVVGSPPTVMRFDLFPLSLNNNYWFQSTTVWWHMYMYKYWFSVDSVS